MYSGTSTREYTVLNSVQLASPQNCQKQLNPFTDVDMIIVSCADDPGVAEIRKVLPDIPVTGGGETTVALALKLWQQELVCLELQTMHLRHIGE